jgi:acetyl esterase/lipase
MSFDSRIDPDLRPALEAIRGMAEHLKRENLPMLRAQTRERSRQMLDQRPENPNVSHHDVQLGDTKVRIHTPTKPSQAPRPGMYFIHGGGMILGPTWMDELSAISYVEQLDCVVVSVEYRLAPEFPHPTPVDDCYAGLKWTGEHVEELGIDPRRLAIAGVSAGGGLAAGTALLARDRDGPKLCYQCLISPMIDDRNQTPSSHEFSGIPSWSREHNDLGWSALLGEKRDGPNVSPYAAPSRAKDLNRLPPALIQVGELEVFRDEDIEYAQRLMQASVPVELHVYPGAFHGWDQLCPTTRVGRQANQHRLAALKQAFASC